MSETIHTPLASEQKAVETPAVEQKPVETPPATPSPVSMGDLTPFIEEYAKDQKLSDASYKALEQRGFSRDVADAFIDGQVAKAARRDAALINAVGGQENLAKIAKWAESLPPAEVEQINALLAGTEAQATLVLQGLAVRAGVAGQKPVATVLSGGGTRPAAEPGVKPYKNQSAMLEAMRNPLYRTSEDYRDDVEARIAVSNF